MATDRVTGPQDREAAPPSNKALLEALLLTWCAEDDHEPVLYEGDVEWVERFAAWLDAHDVAVGEETARLRARLAELEMALGKIAHGPYVFDYEYERFEECQRLAAGVLASGEEPPR